MGEFLNKNFTILVLLGVFVFLYFQGTFSPVLPQKPRVDTVTTYIVGQGSTPAYQPPVVVSTPPVYIPEVAQPDTSYRGLLRQYQQLLDHYYSTNVHKDSIKLDTVGSVYVEDSVRENRIVSRSTSYNYKIPQTTITIREPYRPKGQLYYGGGMQISPVYQLSGASLGLAYKNKKDQILMVGVNYMPATGMSYGLSYYRKISFWRK